MVWSSDKAVQLISALLVYPGLQVLLDPLQAVTGLLEILRSNAVIGSDVFDLQIVATMQANKMRRTYTFNAGDFERFSELTVVRPT